MDDALTWIGRFGGSASIFGVVTLGWWNADRFLSKAASERLSVALTKPRETRDDWDGEVLASTEFLRRMIGPDLPISRFLFSVTVSTLVGIAVFLLLYFMAVPGFFQQMWDDAFARGRVLRFVASYGLPVVFLCTYVSFFFQGLLLANLGRSSIPRLVFYMAFDILMRLVVFALVSAGIFWLFARFFGSFGGSTAAALRAVPETLRGGIRFENLAGVYFYAAVFSAFPLFILLAMKALGRSALLRSTWTRASWLLPVGEKPMRFCVLLVGLVLAFCGLCSATVFDAYGSYLN